MKDKYNIIDLQVMEYVYFRNNLYKLTSDNIEDSTTYVKSLFDKCLRDKNNAEVDIEKLDKKEIFDILNYVIDTLGLIDLGK